MKALRGTRHSFVRKGHFLNLGSHFDGLREGGFGKGANDIRNGLRSFLLIRFQETCIPKLQEMGVAIRDTFVGLFKGVGGLRGGRDAVTSGRKPDRLALSI